MVPHQPTHRIRPLSAVAPCQLPAESSCSSASDLRCRLNLEGFILFLALGCLLFVRMYISSAIGIISTSTILSAFFLSRVSIFGQISALHAARHVFDCRRAL
jgi:hypothetical protein